MRCALIQSQLEFFLASVTFYIQLSRYTSKNLILIVMELSTCPLWSYLSTPNGGSRDSIIGPSWVTVNVDGDTRIGSLIAARELDEIRTGRLSGATSLNCQQRHQIRAFSFNLVGSYRQLQLSTVGVKLWLVGSMNTQ